MEELKQQARAQQREVDLRRLHYHCLLVGLLQGKHTQRALLSRAWREVRRWQRLRLCSQDYIRDWSKLLAGPVPTLVAFLCEDSARGVWLRQNSPFWLVLRRF